MGRNIAAIIAIFLCTTLAWIILGSSIVARTDSSGSELGPRVESTWGAPQEQTPPRAFTTAAPNNALALERSRLQVGLALEQRQKGLLWFPTYRVAYRGLYLFRNDTPSEEITLKLIFPVANAVYDDLVFRVDGQPVPVTTSGGAAVAIIRRPPGAPIQLETGYRSQGMSTWHYSFGEGQPGPLAGRISFFAPVSLLFFFFLIFIISTLRGIRLHPMHYFFLATSFFAFHLLLAYLADHISIHLAFAICSAVSIFLVVSYLRIVTGTRFALVEAALTQFVYLVLFSYAFFLPGFTGLAVTIGAIVSLFVVMQMTARIQWGSGAV